jgi:multidrug resistance efflux pump
MRKASKLTAGLTLICLACYIILVESVTVVSSDAVINSRVAVVRAPINGVLTLEPRTIGQRVRNGEPLGNLSNPRADDTHLLGLERAASELETDITRLRAQIASLEESRSGLRERAEAYREGRIRQLELRIEEQAALLASAKAQSAESSAALRRAEALQFRGVQSVAMLDNVRTAHEVNALNIRAAAVRLDSLHTELEAATKGVFLGDSYNDTPYSSQRLQELEVRLAELGTVLEERAQRLTKTREQVAAERQRLALIRDALLLSPVDGLVWETPSGNGEYARWGQDLLRLLDCTTVIVTASVGESDYNRLKVGDPAQFRLSGTSRVFDAQVLRLAGAGAAGVYGNLAIMPGAEHLARYDVALAVPDLAKDPELGCAVGRTGKVVFSGTPGALLRIPGSWLGLS